MIITKPIIGFMAVYNESEYVSFAIDSTIHYLNSLIIIEGKFAETEGPNTSNDGTTECLQKKCGQYWPKIKVYSGANQPQIVQRSYIFDIARFSESFWLWLIDGDEAYSQDNIEKIGKAIKSTKAESLRINSYVFINDFWHCVHIKMPRLFHIYPGVSYKFIEPNTIAKSGPGGWIRLSEEERPDIFFHHYSYTKSSERFLQKREERIRQTGSFKWNITPEGHIYAPNVNIRVFDGEHPEVMKKHPRYKND